MIHRKDSIHDEIKKAWEKRGYVVDDMSQCDGKLDMHVYKRHNRATWRIEVKCGKNWKLTDAEANYIMAHLECSRIIENEDDVEQCAKGELDPLRTLRAVQLHNQKRSLKWR